jgi:hypothetical protein
VFPCRWKDALVGCFKAGRYPHLEKTARKREGLTVYRLLPDSVPDKSRLKPGMLEDAHISLFPPDFDIENPMTPLPDKGVHHPCSPAVPQSTSKEQLHYEHISTSEGVHGGGADADRSTLEHLFQQRLVNSFRVPNT